jgi:hypothetical protein
MTLAPAIDTTDSASILRTTTGDLFNEMLSVYAEYQEHLNVWPLYEESVEFSADPRRPLPHARAYFHMAATTRAELCSVMTQALMQAKGNGEDLTDATLRQDVFTDALAALFEQIFVNGDATRARQWNAFCDYDEEVYRGTASWEALSGEGRDIKAAWQITRDG